MTATGDVKDDAFLQPDNQTELQFRFTSLSQSDIVFGNSPRWAHQTIWITGQIRDVGSDSEVYNQASVFIPAAEDAEAY